MLSFCERLCKLNEKIESLYRLKMGSANQNEVNLFEMYTRLIADKNAENEALQANIYKRRAANDHIERENDKLELAIEASKLKYKFLMIKQPKILYRCHFFFFFWSS